MNIKFTDLYSILTISTWKLLTWLIDGMLSKAMLVFLDTSTIMESFEYSLQAHARSLAYKFDDRVKDAWSNLSNRPRLKPLRSGIYRLPIDDKSVKTHFSAIRLLRLRSQVVDSLTDYQLRWEHELPAKTISST